MLPIHDQDDRALLVAFCASRSETAFAELVRRHLPLVMCVARRRLNSITVAEDVAQITFGHLATKAASVARHPERLRAWLCRTAFLTAKGLARKESRLSKIPLPPAAEDPAPMESSDRYDRLDAALSRLPELDRELVLRHCCDGEEYRTIAAAVGKSAAACQKRVERALAVLGRRLGGAKTAGAALTAMAAATASSECMPSAARIATLALRHQSSAAGASVGAVTGLQIAACAVLALAGGVAGWERMEAPPELPVAARSSTRPPAEGSTTIATTAGPALSPRPAPIARSLDEILESIQIGRIAPVIEFLPTATPEDLRKMIEQNAALYQPDYQSLGTANLLALRRWIEIDPTAAFTYALPRLESGLPQLALIQWLRSDPPAAIKEYLALPVEVRRSFIAGMAKTETADQLAAADPDVTWVVARKRMFDPVPPPSPTAADDEQTIADYLAGNGSGKPEEEHRSRVLSAFFRLGKEDPERASALGQRIREPEFRAEVLWKLQNPSPPVYQPNSGIAAGGSAVDPQPRLDPAAGGSRPPSDSALESAGERDPRRSLAMLPGIAATIPDADLRKMTRSVLAGWLRHDATEAIRWAVAAGITLSAERDLIDAWDDPAAVVDLMANGNETERDLAEKLMPNVIKAGLIDGSLPEIIRRIPAETADRMLAGIADELAAKGSFVGATELAGSATPEFRQQTLLPNIGLTVLNHGPETMNSWLRSLAPDDRETTMIYVGKRLDESPGMGPQQRQRLRQFLEQVHP